MTDAKPATEYANRICDDDALYSELHELLKRTNTSDAQRLKDVLDEATLQNIVCAITEGSDAIQKRIDTERAARLAAEARVKELEAAGIALYKRWQQFTVERGGWGNQENAYYDLAKHAQHEWNALRAALKEPANA